MARAAACLLLCMVALAMVATHAEVVPQEAPGRDLKNIKIEWPNKEHKWEPKKEHKWEPKKEHKWEHKKEHKWEPKKKCIDVCYRSEHGKKVTCSCSDHHTEKKQVCH